MPSGVWTWVGSGNHVLDAGPDPHANAQYCQGKRYLHDKWLAERARSKILLQRNPSFAEMPDQVHFSCRKPC